MSNDKLADALEHTARHRAATEGIDPDQWRVVLFKWEALALQAHAAEAAQAQAQAAEPVATIQLPDPEASFDEIGPWWDIRDLERLRSLPAGTKLYTHPQPAQDASNPLKGWIFDKVNMGRGDERYICTPNGANATTVRNESTSDHRERLLWLIADAMVKESGR